MKKWLCGMVGLGLLSSVTSAHAMIVRVPEIDAGGAMLALSVLGGLVALLAERRRHK